MAEEAPLQLCQVHWDTLGLEAATQADTDISSATPLNCSPTASSGGDRGRRCLQECGREPVSRWAQQLPLTWRGPDPEAGGEG